MRIEPRNLTGDRVCDFLAVVQELHAGAYTFGHSGRFPDEKRAPYQLVQRRSVDIDFGDRLGRIEALRLSSQGSIPLVPAVLPRLPDGICEFVLCETEEMTSFFAEDELVNRFATRKVEGYTARLAMFAAIKNESFMVTVARKTDAKKTCLFDAMP